MSVSDTIGNISSGGAGVTDWPINWVAIISPTQAPLTNVAKTFLVKDILILLVELKGCFACRSMVYISVSGNEREILSAEKLISAFWGIIDSYS
jgi:hypothetical protein